MTKHPGWVDNFGQFWVYVAYKQNYNIKNAYKLILSMQILLSFKTFKQQNNS